MAGDITLNTPGVGTITKYLAELVAVLHALNWATYSPETRDRPVCVRITGDYGVNILHRLRHMASGKAQGHGAKGAACMESTVPESPRGGVDTAHAP